MREAANPSKSVLSGASARYYEFNNSRTPPKSPTYFQKPLTALNAHKGELIKPKGYKYVNYEG